MRAGLFLAGVALALPAAAETLPEEGEGEIVVTGRGLETAAGTEASVVIGRERLAGTASNRLEDVLADVAGLQSFRRADSRSAHPTAQGITLRGIGGNASSRALLILDGVPQADPFGGWVAFPAYAPAALGEARITRGGGSGLWGPGALTGVVELTSATPGQLEPLAGALSYGSRNSLDGWAGALLAGGSGFASLSAAYARGDGFTPVVGEDRGPADRPAPYEQANVAARAAIDVGGSSELQAAVRAFTDRRDRGLDFTDIASEGADASLRLVGRGRWAYQALAYVQTRHFASRFASVNDSRTATSLTLDQYSVPATGLGARVEVQPPLGEAVRLRLGADTRVAGGRTQELYSFVSGSPTRRRVAGGETQTAGVFADLRTEAGAFSFDLNGRIDGWWIRDGSITERPLAGGAGLADTRFADRQCTEPTGRVGLAWRAAEALTLRAAAYRGWRLPTPNELYRPFRAGADATAANAGLDPERLAGAEVGVAWEARGSFASLTLFRNRLSRAIANVTVAQGPGTFPGVGFVSAAGIYRRRDNLDAIDARGLELEAGATWGPFSARASYAWIGSEVEASGLAAPLDGLRPAQVPEHQASATLAWNAKGARLSLTGRYVAAQFEDDQNSRVLDDAFTLDGIAALPLTRSLGVEARIENALGARVETGFSGEAVERAHPRTIWVGLNASFGN